MSVMTSPDPPVVLVGREEPLRRLRAALDDARSGSSSTIVVSGPPGVGKTALVAQLLSQAADCRVVHARGIETESEWSYAALHQLLMPILQLGEKISSASTAAIEMAIGGAPGAPEPMMVGMGVLGLLSEAAEEKPVLCVLDDVHWMDIASQRALRFATRRLNAERVLVITTQRSDSRDREGWLHSDSEGIELLPLDLAFETELLTRLAGGPVPKEVAVRVHQVTGGVPLGTREVARLLTDSQLSGRDHLPDRLPISGSIHRLFDQSLELLSEDSRHVLLLAAADDSGAAGPVASAARSLGLSNDDFDALESLGWVSFADGQVEFRHPLVRSVVYDSALVGERREAHRALSKAYAAAGDDQRRAWHRALAATPPDQRAADDLAETATSADARNAHAESSAAYQLAATLCESRHRKSEMLTDAAWAAWQAGQLDNALSLADSALSLARDAMTLGRLEYIRGGILLGRGEPARAFELLMSAGVQLADERPNDAVAAWALASEAVSFEGSPSSAATLASMVATNAPTGLDHVSRLKVGMIIGIGHFFQGDFGPAINSMRPAAKDAGDLSSPADLASAARLGFYLGDDEAFFSLNTRAMELAKVTGSHGLLPVMGGRSGLIELLLGRFDLALASSDLSIRLAEDTGQPQLGARSLCWSAVVKAYRGEPEACREFVARSLDVAGGTVSSMTDASRWALGALELGQGNVDKAREHLGSITDVGYQVLAGLDTIEAYQAEHSALAEQLQTTADYSAATGAPWALARAAHGRALLESDEGAESDYKEALEHHRHSQRVFERARTQLAYGVWLRRVRRRKDARQQLQPALEVFDMLSAVPWAQRAEAELRASGGTLHRRGEQSFFDLTPQEVQVARLVGEGMTNREAAAQLYLSPRTVDHHLANVFVKLGISSRTELMKLQMEARRPTELASGDQRTSSRVLSS